jgi:pimeloyl-ACP methyl ester carboxylesterase
VRRRLRLGAGRRPPAGRRHRRPGVVNPLRGLTADGEHVASALGQIDGPVVLVGHSYGGPDITYAGAKAANVKALVYVASLGLDEGVSTLGSVEGFPPSDLGPALVPRTYPKADGTTGTELFIKEDRYPEVFAGDLPLERVRVLAASQRPAADVGCGEPLAVRPGWKTTPSWFVVAGADRTINPTPSARRRTGWAPRSSRSRSRAGRTRSRSRGRTA